MATMCTGALAGGVRIPVPVLFKMWANAHRRSAARPAQEMSVLARASPDIDFTG
jgi:hypothetical protein